MSHCPSCGTEVQHGAKFCTKCGAQVTTAQAENQFLTRCAKCGYEPSNPSKFCIRCGASMLASGAQQTPPPKQQAAPKQTPPKQQTPPPQYTYQQTPPKQQAAQKQAPPKQQTPPPQYTYQQTPPVNHNPNYTPHMAVQQLCSRMRTSSVLLIIAGIIQFLYGIPCLIVGIVSAVEVGRVSSYYSYASYYGYYSPEYTELTVTAVILIIVGILAMIVAIINFVYAGKTRGNAKQIQYNPLQAGTLYKSNGKAIVMLILNILCGGILGIIGSAFAMTARSIVQSNPQVFGVNRY